MGTRQFDADATSSAACCGLDGKLYEAGGYQDGYEVGKNNGKGFLRKVFVLTPNDKDSRSKTLGMGKWNIMPSSTVARGGACLCAMNGQLYLIGGGFALQAHGKRHEREIGLIG